MCEAMGSMKMEMPKLGDSPAVMSVARADNPAMRAVISNNRAMLDKADNELLSDQDVLNAWEWASMFDSDDYCASFIDCIYNMLYRLD